MQAPALPVQDLRAIAHYKWVSGEEEGGKKGQGDIQHERRGGSGSGNEKKGAMK